MIAELLIVVVIALGIGLVVLILVRSASAGENRPGNVRSQGHEQQPNSAEPSYNPETGEWEDWDGTPYGAIEDMLMDTDGDGIWDDFNGDGMPDDWD